MLKTVSYFQDSLLNNHQYNKWVRKKDSDTAFCQYCSQDIRVRNMGGSALKSQSSVNSRRKGFLYLKI